VSVALALSLAWMGGMAMMGAIVSLPDRRKQWVVELIACAVVAAGYSAWWVL
jgi:hypothetical protein